MVRLKSWVLPACLLLCPSLLANAAVVTVDLSKQLSTVTDTALGIHTSVYDNQNQNIALPGQLLASGVNTLRYPGGGYADVYHWAVHKDSPFFGDAGNLGYVASGTDFGKFLKLLDSAQSRAVITVNFGSAMQWNAGHTALVVPTTNGLPQEAAAWVAYANGDPALWGATNDIVLGVDDVGNNWVTAGFWAKLRASTAGQFQTWAGSNYNSAYSFLAINHAAPAGIKYWEIGNETFGSGYYDSAGGDGYSVNYAVPYDSTLRYGHPSLSPANYGQRVNDFAQAMRAVDPSIKIGAVVSTPPGDYAWDIYTGQRWIPQVLQQCASNVDFVIAHWYPFAGNNANGSSLLSAVGTTIPFMLEGQTAGLDSGTNGGLRDWINTYRPNDGTNVQIFITEFNYMGSLAVSNSGRAILGPVDALFAADSYSTWFGMGVANVDYLEMNKTNFLGDSSTLVRGAVYYAAQMVRKIAGTGDTFVGTTSDQSTIRAHAVRQQNGSLGLMLINESRTASQTVNVTVSNAMLSLSGTKYDFGASNFTTVGKSWVPSSGPTTNATSGLGNSFSVNIPIYSMTVLTIPILSNTPPVLNPINDQTVNPGQTVSFIASATDTDQPPQTLTYVLLNGPINATLDGPSGAFSWRPLVTQADSTNSITIRVADNGSPNLTATQSFTVTVNALTPPSVTSVAATNGGFELTVNGLAGPDYALQASSNLLQWDNVFITNSPAVPFIWADTNTAGNPARFYRIVLGPPFP